MRDRIRVGRGSSGRRGKRCGKGNKGSIARNRGRMKFGLQSGGQNPFFRMHGKVGFKSKKAKVKIVDGRRLAGVQGVITRQTLVDMAMVREGQIFKVLRTSKDMKFSQDIWKSRC